jgi:sugar lactone lactonase YvrE
MRQFVLFLTALGLTQAALLAQPSITNHPASQAVWAGANATFTVGAAGTGPFSYQWVLNGTNLPTNIITTLAGGGIGDNGPATNANLSNPTGVVVDTNGNLFIADQENNRVCKVDTNGIITTVAGNGTGTYAGDGGAATNASLYYPTGLALDGKGNLFIADYFNNVIRKVDANGIITTVAGTNSAGFSGDGGPATNAMFSDPRAVAVDARGNLFIADLGNERVRKVDTNGIVTTYAGTNAYGFGGDGGPATNAILWGPAGVTVDTNGALFISDSSNNRIRKVDTNGIITTVAGTNTAGYFGDGGPATNAACTIRVAPLWTRMATCSLPIHLTTAFGRFPAGSSPPWRATARRTSPATAGRQPWLAWAI